MKEYVLKMTIFFKKPIIYPLKQYDVSEFVCVFVCLFPNSSETTKPDELNF